MMNPGLKREPWDRTRPDEDWSIDDPSPKKPAKVERVWNRPPSHTKTKAEMLAEIRERLDLHQALKTHPLPTQVASERERSIVTSAQPTPEKSANISAVELFWQNRICFICGELGSCGHREYAVARAYTGLDSA